MRPSFHSSLAPPPRVALEIRSSRIPSCFRQSRSNGRSSCALIAIWTSYRHTAPDLEVLSGSPAVLTGGYRQDRLPAAICGIHGAALRPEESGNLRTVVGTLVMPTGFGRMIHWQQFSVLDASKFSRLFQVVPWQNIPAIGSPETELLGWSRWWGEYRSRVRSDPRECGSIRGGSWIVGGPRCWIVALPVRRQASRQELGQAK